MSILKSVSFILIACFVLVACGATTASTPSVSTPTVLVVQQQIPTATPVPVPSPTPVPSPVTGGVVNLALVGQPQGLNPIVENSIALREITPLLFDTLLRVNPQTAQLQPGLATGWVYTEDGRQVTFNLPPHLKWNDGTPFTATDIVESLEATRHPALRAFSQITATDDETLTLTFLQIDCAAVTNLAQIPLIPAGQILNPVPVGSGPFKVDHWSDNHRTLTLVRNNHYQADASLLDEIKIRFIAENETDIVLSEGAAQFNLVGLVPSTVITPDNFNKISVTAPQMVQVAINFAPRNGPPLSLPVRKALPLALDRQAILTELLNGRGQLLGGTLPSEHWAATGTQPPPEYNPDEAREILAKAGLTDTDGDGWLDRNGMRLELDIRLNGQNRLHQRLGWLVSSYYRDLGLFARAESIPPDSFIDDLFTHDFRLAILNRRLLPDPDQRMYWHTDEADEGIGLNFSSYSNAQVDELLAAGVAVPGCRAEDRAEIYTQIQEILSRDSPADFLLTPHQNIFVEKYLSGVSPGPFAPFTWNAASWYFEKDN